MMNPEARRKLTEQLKTLDKEKNVGIFPDLVREINTGTRFLIISYGGTGADVLDDLKKSLRKDLVSEDYAKRVRLLAIDTDQNTRTYHSREKDANGQEVVVQKERFEAKEFFFLENGPARNALKNDIDSMSPWINPALVNTIQADNTYLDGNGASSTRQIGRVLLFPQQTVTALETKIRTLVNELTNDNADALKVFIISGISGGTGSGTVIDASYLIRHFIYQKAGMANRTAFCGFILLPPTGVSDNPVDIQKGNRNGYAALKEIDHFMTISYRHELYKQVFGVTTVESDKNIFETCYLVDGSIGAVALSNPRERAKEVIRDCVLDMITSFPADEAGVASQSVDSFMSDAAAYSNAMVRGLPQSVAPRDANYVYCAVGHGKMLIPISLMKAYVASRAYTAVYNLFGFCDNVSADDVGQFLETTVPKKASRQSIAAEINNAIKWYFTHINKNARKGGPFFTINLLNAADGALVGEIQKLQQSGIVLNRAAHNQRIDNLMFAKNVVASRRDQIFTVYVELLEQMKMYFNRESSILTDSVKYTTYTGTTYSFSPIDFTKADNEAAVVRQYLDGLVNPRRIDELAQNLINEMIQNCDRWTELIVPQGQDRPPRFDGANLIREFWERNIGNIVNATIEDYLIKLYSGDRDAHYEEDGNGNPTEKADQALRKAAKVIVDTMLNFGGACANPLVSLRTDLITADNFNGKTIILVPKAAPHLKKYIKNEVSDIRTDKTNYSVLLSTANDRISCFTQYSGIPAFMLHWTRQAEQDYEQFLRGGDYGLHMSETKGGKIWRNYPNLLPENIWPKIEGGHYVCQREKGLADAARDYFLRGLDLGLGKIHSLDAASNIGYYEMSYVRPTSPYGLDDALFKSIDSEFVDSPVWKDAVAKLEKATDELSDKLVALADWEKAESLEKTGVYRALSQLVPDMFGSFGLNYTNTVVAAYTNDATRKPEHWEEELAADLLRQSPEYTTLIRGSILVLEKFYDKVAMIQAKKKYLISFADYVVYGFFTYSEKYLTWSYINEDGAERELLELEYGNAEQKTAEYYFLFQKYLQHADEVDRALAGEVKQMVERDGKDRDERLALQVELKEKRDAFVAQIEPKMTANRAAADQSEVLVSTQFRKSAERKGWNMDDILFFYSRILDAVKNGMISK